MNIDEDAISVKPLAVHFKRVPNIEVIHPNDGLAPRDCPVSTVFTSDCDRVLVTPEPSLVMRKVFKVNVVEDRVRRVLAKIVDVEQIMKVTVIPK